MKMSDPLVISDLIEHSKKLYKSAEWEPFRPGVSAHWLYNEGEGGSAAVFLKYEPGARVSLHEHVGYEFMFILEGDEYDEDGKYNAGSFVINPPGTKHSPGSVGGCIALLIYEKPVRFLES